MSVPGSGPMAGRAGVWGSWATAALDLIYPARCPVCQDRLGPGRRDPLCGRCWEAIPRIASPLCRVCGLPFPQLDRTSGPVAPANLETGPRCGACRVHRASYAYARAAAPFADVLREALHALKFGGKRAMAVPLGDLLVEAGAALLPAGRADLLVPVPLHPRRQRERGFNQAALLAERVGRAWGRPVLASALVRTKATPPQTELSGEARRKNVRDAFAVVRPRQVAGRRVLLIDDVMTTGATVEACAARLRGAGAAEVGVLTVARAV